jgi:hypothetical protein
MLNIDFVFFSVDRQYKNAVFIFQRDRSAFLQLAAMTSVSYQTTCQRLHGRNSVTLYSRYRTVQLSIF